MDPENQKIWAKEVLGRLKEKGIDLGRSATVEPVRRRPENSIIQRISASEQEAAVIPPKESPPVKVPRKPTHVRGPILEAPKSFMEELKKKDSKTQENALGVSIPMDLIRYADGTCSVPKEWHSVYMKEDLRRKITGFVKRLQWAIDLLEKKKEPGYVHIASSHRQVIQELLKILGKKTKKE